jgi:hypothetical protein
VHALLVLRQENEKIGFVWLCFFNLGLNPTAVLGANCDWVCLGLFFIVQNRQKTQKHP